MLLWTLECIYFQTSVFIFFWFMPGSGMARLCDSSAFNFFVILHTVPHSGSSNLHFYQQCTRVPFSKFSPAFIFVVFLVIVILTGARCYSSLWFWFSFPWLVMLSIFSCACWPFVCLPWKNVHSGLLFIFYQVVFACFAIELKKFLIYFGY